MKRGISIVIVLSLVLGVGLFAQITQDKETKLDRVEGLVQSIDKAKSTFSIQQTDTSKVLWQIAFDQNTKFTYRNSAASIDELKEGQRVVCLGKAGTTGKLTAARVDMRTR
jgi:cytochrome c-type biogenesis protein CcmE